MDPGSRPLRGLGRDDGLPVSINLTVSGKVAFHGPLAMAVETLTEPW
jgi:hypothetical protein